MSPGGFTTRAHIDTEILSPLPSLWAGARPLLIAHLDGAGLGDTTRGVYPIFNTGDWYFCSCPKVDPMPLFGNIGTSGMLKFVSEWPLSLHLQTEWFLMTTSTPPPSPPPAPAPAPNLPLPPSYSCLTDATPGSPRTARRKRFLEFNPKALEGFMRVDMRGFLTQPVPRKGGTVKCFIRREKKELVIILGISFTCFGGRGGASPPRVAVSGGGRWG